jgi:hypothetical protein
MNLKNQFDVMKEKGVRWTIGRGIPSGGNHEQSNPGVESTIANMEKR